MDSIAGISDCLNIMLDAINASLMTIIVFQQHSASCVEHSPTDAVQNAQLPFFWPMARYSPELNFIDYQIQGVIEQHEHEFQVTRLNTLSQWLAEVW